VAVLEKLPERQIIDGYKGVLDFYLWKGIPVCRKWPVWRPRTPTPAEKATQDAFAYINHTWTSLDPAIKQAWEQMASGTGLTAKDLSVRAYLLGTP